MMVLIEKRIAKFSSFLSFAIDNGKIIVAHDTYQPGVCTHLKLHAHKLGRLFIRLLTFAAAAEILSAHENFVFPKNKRLR